MGKIKLKKKFKAQDVKRIFAIEFPKAMAKECAKCTKFQEGRRAEREEGQYKSYNLAFWLYLVGLGCGLILGKLIF